MPWNPTLSHSNPQESPCKILLMNCMLVAIIEFSRTWLNLVVGSPSGTAHDVTSSCRPPYPFLSTMNAESPQLLRMSWRDVVVLSCGLPTCQKKNAHQGGEDWVLGARITIEIEAWFLHRDPCYCSHNMLRSKEKFFGCHFSTPFNFAPSCFAWVPHHRYLATIEISTCLLNLQTERKLKMCKNKWFWQYLHVLLYNTNFKKNCGSRCISVTNNVSPSFWSIFNKNS